MGGNTIKNDIKTCLNIIKDEPYFGNLLIDLAKNINKSDKLYKIVDEKIKEFKNESEDQ
ncbi:hypothetical protein IZY60_03560 [Lutibacter sp. B2]|nr:hypothetical protein [Lutibacter sp. B2]